MHQNVFFLQVSLYGNPRSLKFLAKTTQVLTDTLTEMSECQFEGAAQSSNYRDSNFIKTNRVHARSSASVTSNVSPLRNLFNFVKWMHSSTNRR